ncbi:MAG TPA: TnsA-like heteromeric transposase endonuclease subunit [Streptosporangiaceae bacterium]|nr:TnsA-like heteromeric transposase endonuclease subunit [Streptosporangiaceae bacterium]
MTAELAARAGGPAACAGVEVEYVDPDRGRERRPLAACWSARFERVSPVRGFASFRGQRNWPGWWWFSRTGEHVGYESWAERDVLMALDADPGVEAVASQPMWLRWVSESGKVRRHAPDFFVRRADGAGVLVDVRPDHLVRAADSAVFAATAVMAGQAGWAYDRVGELPAVRAANLRWLAGYRHPRYARAAVMAALEEVFAEPGPLRAGAPGWATRWRCCRCCSPCCGAAACPPIWMAGCWIRPRRCGRPGGAGADDPASGPASRRHAAAGRRHAHGGRVR